MEMTIHKEDDFFKIREAGKLAAYILDYITDYVSPGVTTDELDKLCHDEIIKHGAIPAPLNYRGFPKSICTSINHVVCHGIPGERVLIDGDIMNIDVTVILDGWYGDTSRMYYVGKNTPIKGERLTKVTYESMMAGIGVVRPGTTLGDIGKAIQQHAEGAGFSVVRDFCGHGIGKTFHDASINVLHFYSPEMDQYVLQEGMFFTVEPMINAGKYKTKVLSDGWTAVTRDRSLSAQFEHTIGVTSDGHEIFTLSPKGYSMPPYE